MDAMDTSCEPMQRPKWDVDRQLEGFLGEQVRVAAESFTPPRANGELWPRLIPVADLILPDNSSAGALPVYFEGRLEAFERRIGVVDVILSALTGLSESASEGITAFRGSTAVVLPGPARVRLAFPFLVERLPADDENYWRDLRGPRAQLEFPW
jgi:hypothetical protein